MKIEELEQIQIVNYIKLRYPDVLFTIAPNGMRLPISVAKKLKSMGYSKGTPDIMIFDVQSDYAGLFLEIKTPKTIYSKKGILTREQKIWIDKLKEKGYFATVCYGYYEGKVIIDRYLTGKI